MNPLEMFMAIMWLLYFVDVQSDGDFDLPTFWLGRWIHKTAIKLKRRFG